MNANAGISSIFVEVAFAAYILQILFDTLCLCSAFWSLENLVFLSIIQEWNSNFFSFAFFSFIYFYHLSLRVSFLISSPFKSLVHVYHKIWCDGFHYKRKPTTAAAVFGGIWMWISAPIKFSIFVQFSVFAWCSLSICVFIQRCIHLWHRVWFRRYKCYCWVH